MFLKLIVIRGMTSTCHTVTTITQELSSHPLILWSKLANIQIVNIIIQIIFKRFSRFRNLFQPRKF